MKRVIIIGLLFIASMSSGEWMQLKDGEWVQSRVEPYYRYGVINAPVYSVLKTEDWEGQIEALKNTITHLLEYDNRLIFEVVKMGFTIQVSSGTGEIKLIREVK